MSCFMTQRSDACEARTRNLSVSSQALPLIHYAPVIHIKYDVQDATSIMKFNPLYDLIKICGYKITLYAVIKIETNS